MKRYALILLAVLLVMVTAVPGYAAKKDPTITMVILSETESEIDVFLIPPKKAKKDAIQKTIVTSPGINYVKSPKLTKGKWKARVLSYGDSVTRTVDARSGKYTTFFTVAPPKDGDSEQKCNVVQL